MPVSLKPVCFIDSVGITNHDFLPSTVVGASSLTLNWKVTTSGAGSTSMQAPPAGLLLDALV